MNVQYLFDNYGFWPFVIALATMVLTSFAKIPIKLFVSKIEKRTARDLIERFILLIPIAFGIALCYLKDYILKSGEGDTAIVMAGAACGALAIVYYNLFGKYIETAVIKIFKKDAKLDPTEAMSDRALKLATEIAAGKPIESVVKELVKGGTLEDDVDNTVVDQDLKDGDDEEDYDNSADEDEVIEMVCEFTGADEELVATILKQLKG